MEFLADENFNRRILRKLKQLDPDLAVYRVQDTEISGVKDPDLLAWAARYAYVVLTHDKSTMVGYAYARVKRGEPMPGLIVVATSMPIGQAAEDLLLVCGAGTRRDFEDSVMFMPLSPSAAASSAKE